MSISAPSIVKIFSPWIAATMSQLRQPTTSQLQSKSSATTKQYDLPGAGIGNGITEGILEFVLHGSTSEYNSVQSCYQIWILSFHQFDILGYSNYFRFSLHFTLYWQKASYCIQNVGEGCVLPCSHNIFLCYVHYIPLSVKSAI